MFLIILFFFFISETIKKKNKIISNPRLKSWKLWGEDYGFFELNKKTIHLNKPMQVGFSILDLSKTLMVDFHYDYIKKMYGDNAKLIMTDTDSLCYHIRTEDAYKDMIDNKEIFDLSDFPKDHFCFDATNKKVPGKFKLETLQKPVEEMIGLRSKLYSMKLEKEEKKTCKGTKRNVKENKITHQDYVNTLFNGMNMNTKQRGIICKNHKLYSVEMTKTSLSAFNDKSYLLDDGISMLSYGHYKIPKN